MSSTPRDDNFQVAIHGVSSTDPAEEETVPIAVNPDTGAVIVEVA